MNKVSVLENDLFVDIEFSGGEFNEFRIFVFDFTSGISGTAFLDEEGKYFEVEGDTDLLIETVESLFPVEIETGDGLIGHATFASITGKILIPLDNNI